MAIKWTASSEAARQACGKAAARWGNTHAVTGTAEAGTVTVADLNVDISVTTCATVRVRRSHCGCNDAETEGVIGKSRGVNEMHFYYNAAYPIT